MAFSLNKIQNSHTLPVEYKRKQSENHQLFGDNRKANIGELTAIKLKLILD